MDVELQRLEIGTGCNRFLMYRGSPDSKYLWVNQRILNSILAVTGEKNNFFCSWSNSIPALSRYIHNDSRSSIRHHWRPWKSLFGSPYKKAVQKYICVRIKPCTSFSLDSMLINFDIFAIFRRPSKPSFLLQQLDTWDLNFHQKKHLYFSFSLTD